MLVVGAILGCLEPILTVAACLSYKSPFVSPFGMQQVTDRQTDTVKGLEVVEV